MADNKPIIVIKKKGGHGGHHGGAWKVAYADFVTAMMAFFMVMWLVNSAEVITKQNIASYFRRPGIFNQGSGTPLEIGGAGILEDSFAPNAKSSKAKGGKPSDVPSSNTKQFESKTADKKSNKKNPPAIPEAKILATTSGAQPTPVPSIQGVWIPPSGSPQAVTSVDSTTGNPSALTKTGTEEDGQKNQGVSEEEGDQKSGDADAARLKQAAKEIRQLVESSQELKELIGVVDVKFEADGLNIEIMDTQRSSMFQLGSAAIMPEAEAAFAKVARILSTLPNKIDIVGHTDGKGFNRKGYTNWELSTDRANAARRLLEANGVAADRVDRVVGRADKDLRDESDPLAPANRRITLKLRFGSGKLMNVKTLDEAEARKFTQEDQERLETPPTIEKSPKPTTAVNPLPQPTLSSGANESANKAVVQPTNTTAEAEPTPGPTEDPSAGTIAKQYKPKNIVKASSKKSRRAIQIGDDEQAEASASSTSSIDPFSNAPLLGLPNIMQGQ